MALDPNTIAELRAAVHETRTDIEDCGCTICKSKKPHFKDEPGIIAGQKAVAKVFALWRTRILQALANNPPPTSRIKVLKRRLNGLVAKALRFYRIAKDEDDELGIDGEDMRFDIERILREAFPDKEAAISELMDAGLVSGFEGLDTGIERAARMLELDAEEVIQALQQPLRYSMEQTAYKYCQSTLERIDTSIKEMLVDGLNEGLPPQKMGEQIEEQFAGLEDWEALRIARTEFARGQSKGILGSMKQSGQTFVKWLATPDCCEICAGYADRIWPIDMVGDALPCHPHDRCTWDVVYELAEGEEVETEPPTNVFDDPDLAKDPWPTLEQERAATKAQQIGKDAEFESKHPRDGSGRFAGYQQGDCFGNAIKYATKNKLPEDARVVHGHVTNAAGKRLAHAWIEAGSKVIDPTQGVEMDRTKWYELVSAKADAKYTEREAVRAMIASGHKGPWGKDELSKAWDESAHPRGDGGRFAEVVGGGQTETPEFKAWFGGSKVVDESGNPLVVHRGIVGNWSNAPRKNLQWFSASAEDAADYVHGKRNAYVLSAYLCIQNPADIENDPKVLRILKKLGAEPEDLFDLTSNTKVHEALKAAGYDGIQAYHWGSGVNHYAPFSGTQVKSALGNRGTFDPHDADITKSDAELIAKYSDDQPRDEQGRWSGTGTARQTDSPQFKTWFEGSKVVDATGAPLVVYHGTKKDFSEFDPKARKRTRGGRELKGVGAMFFTDNPQVSDAYAGVATSYKGDKWSWPANDFEGGRIMPVYLALKNPLVIESAGAIYHQVEQQIKQAKRDGHDGVIIREVYDTPGAAGSLSAYKHTSYVVFSPSQIKSATGNRGSFDPRETDITKAEEPVAKYSDDQARDERGRWTDGGSDIGNSALLADAGSIGAAQARFDASKLAAQYEKLKDLPTGKLTSIENMRVGVALWKERMNLRLLPFESSELAVARGDKNAEKKMAQDAAERIAAAKPELVSREVRASVAKAAETVLASAGNTRAMQVSGLQVPDVYVLARREDGTETPLAEWNVDHINVYDASAPVENRHFMAANPEGKSTPAVPGVSLVSGGTWEEVLTHELGHGIQQAIEERNLRAGKGPDPEEWTKLFEAYKAENFDADGRSTGFNDGKYISYYSFENRKEAFAETYALVQKGGYDKSQYSAAAQALINWMEKAVK